MTIYHDDNFGTWDMEDEDQRAFYEHVQRTNVEKECAGCERIVRIQPHYDICDSCARKREQGWDI